MLIRTLQSIPDPRNGGASISAGVKIDLPKSIAERLIKDGKAEKAKKNDR